MTVLGSGVYLVYRLIALALGVGPQGNLLAELGQAIAYSLMAVGIWLYHGAILRADGRRAQAVKTERLASVRVVVLDGGDESLGRALLEELQRELAGLDLQALDASAADAPAVLAGADLIVGPWMAATAGDEVARAIAGNPSPKLLLPTATEGWHWAGVGELKDKDIIRHTVRAVKQFTSGEEIKGRRGRLLGCFSLFIGLPIPLLILFAGRMLLQG